MDFLSMHINLPPKSLAGIIVFLLVVVIGGLLWFERRLTRLETGLKFVIKWIKGQNVNSDDLNGKDR